MPGPVPKRQSQRRRANKPDVPVDEAPSGVQIEPPPADPGWHPIARSLYESLEQSGQSEFYEASDWWAAYALAESMSREFQPQPIVVGKGENATVEMHKLPPKGASLTAWLKAMGSLLVMEGDRRRLRLELGKGATEEVTGDVSWIDDARARLKSG